MTPDEQHRIFDRWIDQHKGLVFKVVHASTMTPEDRNDLFQDIAIQLWKSVPHFEGNAKESTWVFRVALNTAAVWTRRESRYRTRMESRSNLDGVIHEEVRGRNEQLDWLYDEIRKLDAVNRSLMLLVLEGYSYQDVAEQLGITASNVGVKLNRLKKQLARIAKGVAQ